MLINLFISFVLIGLGAYGGGLVTIPLMQHELVEARHWLGFTEMARIVAIAQITPGPIAINAATFTGFRINGFLGAAVATISVVLPSIAILALLVPSLHRVKKYRYLNRFRQGIQIGVLSLILFAVWSYGRAAVRGWLDLAIAASAFFLLVAFEKRLHPIFIILGCGIIGLLIK